MRNPRGFTFMELMITIAIIAVLSAVAIPNAIAWRNNAQFNASVRRVKDTLEQARMEAIKSHLPVDVLFNSANAYDTQTRRFDGATQAVALQAPVTHRLSPGVTINFNSGPQITFNSRGMTGNNGTLTLRHAGFSDRQIVVSILGSSVIQ